jgi:hypothetical protein
MRKLKSKLILWVYSNIVKKRLYNECKRVNKELVKKGLMDNPSIVITKFMSSTFFEDYKNVKSRLNDLHNLCLKHGLDGGIVLYFRDPLKFIQIGKELLK